MILKTMFSQKARWLEAKGALSEVVISSRIRLARNLANIPFSHIASLSTLNKVVLLVTNVIKHSEYLVNSTIIKLNEITKLDREFLFERHLISREQLKGEEGKAVIIGEKEIIAIMINEEDHLRLQCIQSGLQIIEGWRLLDKIDSDLEKELNYAFSAEWGYLTACPTNAGTGLRASVLVHLPALIISKKINKILQGISKLHMSIRGLYGEGTETIGDFFQISNQITLGQDEENLINNIEGLIKQVVEQEQKTREDLLKKKRVWLEDRVWRAYGILKNARFISSQETLELLSALRLGIHLGIISDINITDLNELLISTQPAHLQILIGKEISPEERDIKRADFIREKLKK